MADDRSKKFSHTDDDLEHLVFRDAYGKQINPLVDIDARIKLLQILKDDPDLTEEERAKVRDELAQLTGPGAT